MFGTLTILVIILAIIITAQNSTKKNESKPETDVLDSSSVQMQNPTSIRTPSLTPTDKPTPTHSSTPTPTPTTFIPTSQPIYDNQSILDFKYPNSIIISQNGNETIYESTDNPKKITHWYKNTIKNLGMKATSFVQTSTNGNILNKLVGASSEQEVRVEISKQNNSAAVKIIVVSN